MDRDLSSLQTLGSHSLTNPAPVKYKSSDSSSTSSYVIPPRDLSTPIDMDSTTGELRTRLLNTVLKGVVRSLVAGDLNLRYRAKVQTRLMDRTSRESALKLLEMSRHRARSAESVSRFRISRSRGGGRSSMEK